MAAILTVAWQQAPCVVFFDEVEKLLQSTACLAQPTRTRMSPTSLKAQADHPGASAAGHHPALSNTAQRYAPSLIIPRLRCPSRASSFLRCNSNPATPGHVCTPIHYQKASLCRMLKPLCASSFLRCNPLRQHQGTSAPLFTSRKQVCADAPNLKLQSDSPSTPRWLHHLCPLHCLRRARCLPALLAHYLSPGCFNWSSTHGRLTLLD